MYQALIAVICILLLPWQGAYSEERVWTLTNTNVPPADCTLTGRFDAFTNGVVNVVTADKQKISVPLDNLSNADRQYVLLLEDVPFLSKQPAWRPGYKIRYTLRAIGDQLSITSKTVMASLPTGGWLKPDASDVLVTTAEGKLLPAAVLSQDLKGNSIIQFNRHENDRWYWVYAVGPASPSAVEPTLAKQIADAKAATEEALKSKMNAQLTTGERAEELRKAVDQIALERKTIADATAEIAGWDKLLPERSAAASSAAGKVPPAKEAVVQASAESTAANAKAEEEMALARKTADEAAVAEKTLSFRLAAAKAAGKKSEAEKNLAELAAAAGKAQDAVDEGKAAATRAAALKANAEHSLSVLTLKIQPLEQALAAAKAATVTAVETARGKAEEYRRLAADADPILHQEGLTVEFREWAGTELGDWGIVLAGLRQSENVLGNALVSEVIQYLNPTRRGNPRNFAASYRGYLKIDKPGIYRVFVNGDDAAFLFIDGYKVYAREGTNQPVAGNIGVYSIGVDLELEEGVHQCEIYSVIGNAPGAKGYCNFLWLPPGSTEWTYVPPSAFTRAMLAQAVRIEEASGGQAAAFSCGIDDVLTSDGITLYLVRFEALGHISRSDKLIWNFGDGTTGTGQSVAHVYFQKGDYEVTLQSAAGLPAFRRRIHVWDASLPTSPYSLPKAVEVLGGMDLSKLDQASLNEIFDFLLICEQPDRWPTLERLGRLLLARPGLDLKYRMIVYTSLMEAMAQQGRGAEALALMNQALAEVPKLRTLQIGIILKAADIYRVHLKDFAEAGRLYEKLIAENKRLEHPLVRQAAVAWGDMFLEAEDMARAGDAYRLAMALGQKGVTGEKQTDAATRGALLRLAEQQLKDGNIHQTRRLLERIETEFPEQKLEGLYRFLWGETDRNAGRYEEAIRNYEVLLKLRQWAGYRAPALYGIADSYYRMNNFNKALQWLKGVKDSFPTFYDNKKLANYQAMLESRIDRIQKANPNDPSGAGGSNVIAAAFAGYQTGFESDENPPAAPPDGFKIISSSGIDGPRTAMLETLSSGSKSGAYSRSLPNIMSGGMIWIEFWYRNTLTPAEVLVSPQVQAEFYGSDNQLSSRQTAYLDRTYGQWQKVAFGLQSPLTQDGRLRLAFNNLDGFFEIDGLKIWPISDRQNEALRCFIEGASPP